MATTKSQLLLPPRRPVHVELRFFTINYRLARSQNTCAGAEDGQEAAPTESGLTASFAEVSGSEVHAATLSFLTFTVCNMATGGGKWQGWGGEGKVKSDAQR